MASTCVLRVTQLYGKSAGMEGSLYYVRRELKETLASGRLGFAGGNDLLWCELGSDTRQPCKFVRIKSRRWKSTLVKIAAPFSLRGAVCQILYSNIPEL